MGGPSWKLTLSFAFSFFIAATILFLISSPSSSSSPSFNTQSQFPKREERKKEKEEGREREREKKVPLRTDLGDERVPIFTFNPLAQQYSNQGIRYLIAFNFPLAFDNFEFAASIDKECLFCYWGQAFSLGRNLNRGMSREAHAKALGCMETGKQILNSLDIESYDLKQKRLLDRDIALFLSLEARYETSWDDFVRVGKEINTHYAQRMEQLASLYPDDLTVLYLTADAFMNVSPWDYYINDGKTLKPNAKIAKDLVHKILDVDPNHPGAIHLLIHLTEASASPGEALPYAKKLTELVKGSSHLQHMPSHTFIRLGKYEDSAVANEEALAASDEVYPMHNAQFLLYSLRITGQRHEALDVAKNLVARASQNLENRESGFPTERFVVEEIFTFVVFEEWDSLMELRPPPVNYTYWTAIWRFGRVMALSSLISSNRGGYTKTDLENESRELRSAANRCQENRDKLEPINVDYLMQMYIGISEGYQFRVDGEYFDSVQPLQTAMKLEEKLEYDEPPIFIRPVSHYLGPSLFFDSQFKRAIETFEESLQRYPHDGWALQGLARVCAVEGGHEICQKNTLDSSVYWRFSEVSWDPYFHVNVISGPSIATIIGALIIVFCVLMLFVVWFSHTLVRLNRPLFPLKSQKVSG